VIGAATTDTSPCAPDTVTVNSTTQSIIVGISAGGAIE
jgi:hypothetical protein